MAVAAVGGEDGRVNALTVILPLKWWGRAWLIVGFTTLRMRAARGWGFLNIDRLRFISAIRWSVLPPFTRRRRPWGRSQDERWQMLFESNFDGDWDEYLDSFGSVTTLLLRSVASTGIGYPGLSTPTLFKDYARAHDRIPEAYLSAYRDLTAADIRLEILARYGDAARKAIAREGYGRKSPLWTTFLLPLESGRVGAAGRAARELAEGAVLLSTGKVHFARIVVLGQLGGAWLLITLVHDGEVSPILRELMAVDSKTDGRMRELLDCVTGVPAPSAGWWDNARMVDLLLKSRPKASRDFVAYCAYPRYTVGAVADFAANPQRYGRWPARQSIS